MTREKEVFKPLKEKGVGIYTCGPTVYFYAHIGNLRSYVFADILKRIFLYNNYKVKHVMNITDVGHLTSDADTGEDKIEKAKKREGKNAWEIAKFYEKAFFADTEKMNIIKPDITPRATEEIDSQIELIKKIEENGYTYKTEDGIYFDTSKLENYGKLSGMDIKNLKAGARVKVVEGKRNPSDFALWKFSPEDEKRDMEWDSPWGKGFPGWHAECSAMSMKYLGKNFDIHTGGIDHIPIHHTNEIAQSVAANGVEPVNYWMHNEFLTEKGGKMAKSKGEVLTINSLIEKGYNPLDYRYLLLTSHYRSQIVFTWEALEGARKTLQRLKNICLDIKTDEKLKVNEDYKEKFFKAINNDLDTPNALAVLWEMLRNDKVNKEEKYSTLLKFDKILGLSLESIDEEEIPDEIKRLSEKREKARQSKDWKEADEIRNQIKKEGWVVEDSDKGPKFKKL